MPNLALADNPRTANKAAIARASVRARRDLHKIDKQGLKDLAAAYRRSVESLTNTLNNNAGADGSVKLDVLQSVLSQAQQQLNFLEREKSQILTAAQRQSVEIGVSPWSTEAAVLGSSLATIATDALLFSQNFIANDGLQLSDRIWRNSNHTKQVVVDAIQRSIIEGHSASQAAQDFIARGLPIPSDLARKITSADARGIAKKFRNELMTGVGNPYDNALRLFRTELNRAHGEAFRAAAFEHPDVIGMRFLLSPNHPDVDICDMHASVNNYGMGKGVYPKDKSPWPAHPNTLSFEVAVFIDDVAPSDKEGKQTRIDWIKSQPPHVQLGVLNSRKKRAALLNGLLTDNQIKTPWKVLKARYIKRGVDVNNLRIPSTLKTTDNMRGDGIAHVFNRGLETGHEHASAVDMGKGIEFFRTTDRKKSSVSFSAVQMNYLANPKNNIELIHNHPSSTSLSLADLNVGSFPGVNRVVAVGHDEAIYSAVTLVKSQQLLETGKKVFRIAERKVINMHLDGKIALPDANMLYAHLANSALDNLGLIQYKTERRVTLKKVLQKFDELDLVNSILEEFSNGA